MTLNPCYHETPDVLHMGTLPHHAHFVPFATAQQALDTPLWEAAKSPRVKMLSGSEWAFGYYESYDEVPEGFFAPGFDATGFGRIPVPGCWQMFGHGGHQYTNTRYPFPYDPPHVPVQNPCGAYIRPFTLTEEESAGQMSLRFEGVDSCYYVWLNGALLGYSQVSHSTSEFDVSGKVQPGENTLAVLVLKWCDGSYLEDQDKLRMSGIFRDVYLVQRPQNHITDFFVSTDFSKDFSSAEVNVECSWQGAKPEMKCSLLSPEGEVLSSQPLAKKNAFTVADPRLWNAETPVLYTLLFEGEEAIAQDVGLRKVEVKKGVIYLNGQNVKLKGVNRHDSDPLTGYVISPAQLEKDLVMMKQANQNAIRTSHYPNAPWAVQMFSRLGFYTIAEADQESHGTVNLYGTRDTKDYFALVNEDPWAGLTASNPIFHDAIVDRTIMNVERDKNAAGVLIWSLGNESGYSRAFENAAAYAKKRDPRRLVHYEGMIYQMPGHENDWSNIDVYSHMYAPVEAMERYFEDNKLQKPFIHCEFCHAMGNGPGDLEANYEQMYRQDGYAGGFVWEWCDHGVYQGVSPDGRKKFFYGGDFGEFPHDGDFCMDGLVYPDRRPHTGYYELKNVARPARVTAQNPAKNQVTVYNTLDFTPLDEVLEAECVLLVDGREEQAVALPQKLLAIPPHGSAAITLPVEPPKGKDSSVLIRWRRREDSFFAAGGSEAGFDQVFLKALPGKLPAGQAGRLDVREDTRSVTVSTEAFSYVLDKRSGLFSSMVNGNVNYLQKPMELNIWRAPTSNDRNIRLEWEAAGYDRATPRVYTVKVSKKKTAVQITVDASLCAIYLQPLLKLTLVWTIQADGRVQAEVKAARDAVLPFLPRFGLRMHLPADFATVRYTGYGPGECYEDKQQACWRAAFETTVQNLLEDYTRPQENGAHTGCTSLELASPAGRLLAAGEAFSFSALPYTQEELTRKAHNWELEPAGATVLCIDYRQSGLGSNSCGPELPGRFRLDEDSFSWSVELGFTQENRQ